MTKVNLRSMVSAAALAGVLTFAPSTVFAQTQPAAEVDADTGPEIVVTAQRRAEKSVDVPITVATLSNEQLQTANVSQLSGISHLTPALRFDNQAAFAQPSIRGIGTGVVTSGGGANVGIYVDGFYSPNPLAADFELMKVKNVQVLKGPQGTLFGRNTTGGAILVQTADPSSTTAGEAKISYGKFNEKKAQAYATFGLADAVAFDIEGLYRQGDGFTTNITNGDTKVGKHKSWSIRAGLKVNLSDNVSVLARYTHSDVNDPSSLLTSSNVDSTIDPSTGRAFGTQTRVVPGTFTTTPGSYASGAQTQVFTAKTDVAQFTIKADLGFANLTSYSQYRTEDVDISEDLDHTGLTIFSVGIPVNNATFSQEFLLTSKPGTPLQWTGGLFYFSNRDTYRTSVDNTPGLRIPLGGSSTTTRSYAAFADVTYAVNPKFFITGGLRYSHDQIDDAYYIVGFSGVQTPVTKAQADAVRGNRVTPRVVLRYKPTDQSSIYASYSKGYKAGLLDVGGSTGNPVLPESIDAFELGYKFDNRKLSFDLAGFYYNYKDLQVSLFKGSPPSAQLVNAAKSEIYGLEGAMRYQVTPSFDFNMGAAWTHARYKSFVNAPIYASCPAAGCGGGTIFFVQSGVTLNNVTMQRTPEFTGNIGARYRTDLGGGKLALSGNLYYTSKFFLSPSGTQFLQKGYEVLSMRAQWTDASDHVTLAVYGDNLTNRRYRTQVQYNNFGIGSTYSAPTTFGVELGYKF